MNHKTTCKGKIKKEEVESKSEMIDVNEKTWLDGESVDISKQICGEIAGTLSTW